MLSLLTSTSATINIYRFYHCYRKNRCREAGSQKSTHTCENRHTSIHKHPNFCTHINKQYIPLNKRKTSIKAHAHGHTLPCTNIHTHIFLIV